MAKEQIITIYQCNKCGHLQSAMQYCACGAGHMELKKVKVKVLEEVE